MRRETTTVRALLHGRLYYLSGAGSLGPAGNAVERLGQTILVAQDGGGELAVRENGAN